MLRFKELITLTQIFDLTLKLVDRVGKVIVLTLDDGVEVLFLERPLLQSFIPHSVSLVLLHHHVMVPLEQLDHFVFLHLLCDFKVQELTGISYSIGFSIASSKSLALQLVELVAHHIVLMKQLLLISFELTDKFLFAIIVRFVLLHQLLV